MIVTKGYFAYVEKQNHIIMIRKGLFLTMTAYMCVMNAGLLKNMKCKILIIVSIIVMFAVIQSFIIGLK